MAHEDISQCGSQWRTHHSVIALLIMLLVNENNFLIDYQYVFGFYKDFRPKRSIASLRSILVKSDFTSKLARTRL